MLDGKPLEPRRYLSIDGPGIPMRKEETEGIRGTCEIFDGGKVTFVPGLFHCLEYAADAVKAILPAGAERDRRFGEVRADIEAGRAAKVVRELEPFSARYGFWPVCRQWWPSGRRNGFFRARKAIRFPDFRAQVAVRCQEKLAWDDPGIRPSPC